jgi:hypothetical protein
MSSKIFFFVNALFLFYFAMNNRSIEKIDKKGGALPMCDNCRGSVA